MKKKREIACKRHSAGGNFDEKREITHSFKNTHYEDKTDDFAAPPASERGGTAGCLLRKAETDTKQDGQSSEGNTGNDRDAERECGKQRGGTERQRRVSRP